MSTSLWYDLSIYWFLHFLYNGFFMLVVLAYLIYQSKDEINHRKVFWLMNTSIIPIYALSTLWLTPHLSIYAIALLGAILQIIAFWLLMHNFNLRKLFSTVFTKKIYLLLTIAYVLKITFQVFSILPSVQDFLRQTVSYSIIGFIHLVMLGFFTLIFLIIFIEHELIKHSKLLKIGILLLVFGILLSEGLLFYQSLAIYFENFIFPNFFISLLWVSSLMPLGFGLILYNELASNE